MHGKRETKEEKKEERALKRVKNGRAKGGKSLRSQTIKEEEKKGR